MVLTADRPQYRHVGDGKFEPCNDAAWIECQRWNAYADAWNARTAGRNAL